MSNTVRDLPVIDRPRERLDSFGASSLSLQELLEIVLGSGGAKGSVLEIARKILVRFKNLKDLNNASVKDLGEIEGIGPAKAVQIKAAFELGKRLQLETIHPEAGSIFTHLDAYRIADKYLRDEKKEYLMLFCLDSRSRLVAEPQTISIGTLDASLIHPREVFVTAIKNYASRVILVHNHPSGSSQPSDADLEVTKQVYEAGKVVGIQLLDHLIIGLGEYVSTHESFPQLFE